MHVSRVACVDDDGATFDELAAIDARVQTEVSALGWVHDLAAGLPPASGIKQLIALSLGGRLGAWTPSVMKLFREIGRGPRELHRLAAVVMRMVPVATTPLDLSVLLRAPVTPSLRAAVLPVAFERGLPDGEALMVLLDQPAIVAEEAAALLAWCRVHDGGPRVLDRAAREPPSSFSDALLLAGIAHGEREAIQSVRNRLDSGAGSRWLVDALAVAGDSADAGRLLAVARGGGPLAPYALLAAAHLGNPVHLPAMKGLRDSLEPLLIDRATAAMAGPTGAPEPGADVRLIGGRPWSISAALQRLSTPGSEPLPMLRWTTLELAIRTGLPAPCIYDSASSTERQRGAAAAFVTACSRVQEPPAGRWWYFGRALPRGARQ
jgi:hypothetical protein